MSSLTCEVCGATIIMPFMPHEEYCIHYMPPIGDRCTCPDDRGEPGLHHLECCPRHYIPEIEETNPIKRKPTSGY